MKHAPLVAMRNIGKTYADEVMEAHALTQVDLSFSAGAFISVTGPSGSGKSTLLSIMGLIDPFTSGSYRLNGLDTAVLDAEGLARVRNTQIGYVFRSANLMARLTAAENVALPLTWRKLEMQDIRTRVRLALDRVGLGNRMERYPHQLSAGQQQRVAIARALAGQPSLILADEPAGNLDSKNGDAIMQLLVSLNKDGAALVLATHNGETAAMANRVLELLDGRVVGDQAP